MEPKIKTLEDISTTTWNWKNDGQTVGHESTDTVTLNLDNYSNTVIGGGYSYPNTISAPVGPFTISGGTVISNPWTTYTSTPKIKLDGEGADIEVNGWSLMDAIQKIEERLNILHPNDELEAEWAELRELGDQYRRLEQHIQEKQATWDRLKAMPPPVVE